VLLIWVLLSALLTRLRAVTAASRPSARHAGSRPQRPGRAAERLLRCATCGVRVPESRALLAGGGRQTSGTAFCSDACRRQAMRDSA
jgi:hypothetical protein